MSLTADRTEESSNLALETHAALGEGDTERARELYAAAGDKLAEGVRNERKRPEQDLLRFLAASQYYKGGLYDRAREMCRKVEERQLPDKVRHLFPDFRRDVNDRASPGYADGVRNRLRGLWGLRQFREILDLLAEHPYVLTRGDLAFIRAVCCENLKDYRAAALFFSDALRWGSDDPDMMCHSAAAPLMMVHEGRLTEAEVYVAHQLELLPHPLTHVAASLLCFDQAKEPRKAAEERRKLLNLQMRHCDLVSVP
jgi:tetratricopeptide (TPR) repeat protein